MQKKHILQFVFHTSQLQLQLKWMALSLMNIGRKIAAVIGI